MVDACLSYHQHGAAFIRLNDVLDECCKTQYDEVLQELELWCRETDDWMLSEAGTEHRMGWKNRSDESVPDECGLRFSVNFQQNKWHPAWNAVRAYLLSRGSLLDSVVKRVLCPMDGIRIGLFVLPNIGSSPIGNTTTQPSWCHPIWPMPNDSKSTHSGFIGSSPIGITTTQPSWCHPIWPMPNDSKSTHSGFIVRLQLLSDWMLQSALPIAIHRLRYRVYPLARCLGAISKR